MSFASTVRQPSAEPARTGRSRSVSIATAARYPSTEPAARSRSRGRAPGTAVEDAPAAAAPGAAGNHAIFLPTSGEAKKERAKVAARIKRKQPEEVSEGAKTPVKRVRIRAGTGRPRGRPRKAAANHGFADGPDVPAGSSKTPGVVAAAQEAAAKAPSKSLSAKAAAKSRVRVVPISSDGSFAPRRRGRPKGSVGVKRRAAGGVRRPTNDEL